MKASLFLFSLLFCGLIAVAQAPVTPLHYTAPQPTPAETEDTLAPVEKKFKPENLVIGGSLGASFGNYTFVNISPQVGYYFNQYITAGVGINYVYSSEKIYEGFTDYSYKYNYSYAGLGIFGRFYPIRFLFVSAQPELNYNWGKIKFNDNDPVYGRDPDIKVDGLFVPSVLVGAGAILSPSGRGGMMISIQYDLVQYKKNGISYSPYGSNPYLNIGFAF